MNKIAIQGQPASFHDVAARQFFGDNIELVCCDLPFSLVFDKLINRESDYAVCAIENSLYGSIPEVYDLLLKHKTWIMGEVILHIEQCLVGLPSADLADISDVYSHPVALAQCEQYLDSNLPHATRHAADDTAGSANLVRLSNDKSRAAIASAAAAEHYGLKILANSIETDHHNYTRFAILSRRTIWNDDANKLSLVLTTNHKPGALYAALGVFEHEGLNLSLLVSRPIIGKPGKYLFYVDIEAKLDKPETENLVDRLQQLGCETVVLGSYVGSDVIKRL